MCLTLPEDLGAVGCRGQPLPSTAQDLCLHPSPSRDGKVLMEFVVLPAESVVQIMIPHGAAHQKSKEGKKLLQKRKLGVVSISPGLVQFRVREEKSLVFF